mgnify:CR=1 FL=1
MTRLCIILIFLSLMIACDSGVVRIVQPDKDAAAGADEDDPLFTDDAEMSDQSDGADLSDDMATDDTTDDATDDTTADDLSDQSDQFVTDDTVTDDTTDDPLPDDVTTDDIIDDIVDDDQSDPLDDDTTVDDTPLPDLDMFVDTTAPTILGTLPQDEATGIPAGTTIEIEFSEPLDTETITDSFSLMLNDTPIDFTHAWRSDDNTVILIPDASLTPGATYAVTVKTTLTDLAGNPLEAEYLFEFTVSLCGNGVPELGEQCDLGVGNGDCATCTTLCVSKPANFCGDGFICDTEQCETGQTATCAAALGDTDAVGTAPCNGTCGGFTTAANCTRTFSCAAKPANSEWNTVDHYTQTWNGSVWVPASDVTTDHDETPTDAECRFVCADGYVWNDIQCVVLPPECGDGAPDAGEDCDDGNGLNADACKNDCTFNTCGDGVAGGSLPALIYTFENGGSMPTNGVTNGSPGWVISTTQKHAGTYSARSATMGDKAAATITFTGLSDGDICYWRAGSSEFDFDFFTVTIDGDKKEELSGLNQTWTQKCWAVTPGNHTIVFRYAKDDYVAENWDAWYIDDLQFSGGGVEECDDGNVVNTDACKNNCSNNICGDGVVYTGVETCDTIGMACATLLSIPTATGTAPCNGECTGYIPVGNCAKTNTCPAKPAAGTVWNTVSSFTQSWTGSAWNPVDDTSTTYNATGSTTECRYACAFNWSWDGTACVTTDFLAETIGQISEQNLTDSVYYLAGSECDGRNNNTAGSTAARTYIIDQITDIGLTPGGAGGTWTQGFSNYYCNGNWRTGTNIIGYIEGSDPALKDEYLVIGAHYDHLGHTGTTFYPGSDDNASGSAALIEMAAALKRIQSHLGRSVVFIWFDAEEDGLCGSEYYNDNPLYTLSDTVYMLNLDMVGYLRSNAIELTDANGSTWANTTLSVIADKYGLTESFEDCGYECSDHAPFYNSGVPSVMLTTGLEDVYHQTTDTPNLINYDGLLTVASFATEFAYEVTVHTEPFLFYAPYEAPRIWQPREFRDHGVLPLE